MNKLLVTGSLMCLVLLMLASTLFPHDILMQLAGTSLASNIFRGFAAIVLLAVLFSNPPRQLALRVTMGSAALVLIGACAYISMGDSMHLLDALLYLQLGCVLGIEALEFDEGELMEQAQRFQALSRQETKIPY